MPLVFYLYRSKVYDEIADIFRYALSVIKGD